MRSARKLSVFRSAVHGGLALTLLTVASCGLLAHQVDANPVAVVAADRPEDSRGAIADGNEALATDFTLAESMLPGRLGLAIMPVGGSRATVMGDLTTGSAWSTIKVPIAVAALRNDPDGLLDYAEAAITYSDNDAAGTLWNSLGSGAVQAVQRVLDEADDTMPGGPWPHTTVDDYAFGATEWSLADQVRFASQLPCLPETATVTDLMSQITDEQRWGLGSLDGAIFKGGWGPDDETGVYLVRQFGLVPVRDGYVAVAMAAQADSGDFDTATQMLDTLAALLGEHLHETRSGDCSAAGSVIAALPSIGRLTAQPGTTRPDS